MTAGRRQIEAQKQWPVASGAGKIQSQGTLVPVVVNLANMFALKIFAQAHGFGGRVLRGLGLFRNRKQGRPGPAVLENQMEFARCGAVFEGEDEKQGFRRQAINFMQPRPGDEGGKLGRDAAKNVGVHDLYPLGETSPGWRVFRTTTFFGRPIPRWRIFRTGAGWSL